METKQVYLGLDIGNRRIGVAVADSIAKIAQPLGTLQTGGDMRSRLLAYLKEYQVTDVVIGRPRNQSGETTAQTQATQAFVAANLHGLPQQLHWQDESVTSVLAEERLRARKKPYSKSDIDAEAAAIILQDYLEVA